MSFVTVAQVSDYKLTAKSKVMKVDFKWEIYNFAYQFTENWRSNCSMAENVVDAHGTNVRWKLQMVTDCDGFLCVEVKQWEFAKNSAVDSKMQVHLNVCICDTNMQKCYVSDSQKFLAVL